MFLIVGKAGYYLGLSMEAAKEHSKALRMKPEDVIYCKDWKDVKRCLDAYAGKGAGDDIIAEKVVYWPQPRIQVLCDYESGVSYRCYSNGRVDVRTSDGIVHSCKICQGVLHDRKKKCQFPEKTRTIVVLRLCK